MTADLHRNRTLGLLPGRRTTSLTIALASAIGAAGAARLRAGAVTDEARRIAAVELGTAAALLVGLPVRALGIPLTGVTAGVLANDLLRQRREDDVPIAMAPVAALTAVAAALFVTRLVRRR